MSQHKSEAVDFSGIAETIPAETTVITEPKRGRGRPPKVQQAQAAPSGTSEVPTEFLTGLLAMFAQKMNENNLLFAEKLNEAIKAAKEPPVDPIKQKQHERAQEAKRRAEESYWTAMKQKAVNCNHTREDLTSAVAWATQSDGVVRGSCQHCQTLFSPHRNECVSEEVWKQYKDRLRVPTSRGNSVVYL